MILNYEANCTGVLTMNWTEMGTIIGGLAALGGYMTWFVKATIREQNDDLLQRINGTYLRSAKSTLTGAEIERRLSALESIQGQHKHHATGL